MEKDGIGGKEADERRGGREKRKGKEKKRREERREEERTRGGGVYDGRKQLKVHRLKPITPLHYSPSATEKREERRTKNPLLSPPLT